MPTPSSSASSSPSSTPAGSPILMLSGLSQVEHNVFGMVEFNRRQRVPSSNVSCPVFCILKSFSIAIFCVTICASVFAMRCFLHAIFDSANFPQETMNLMCLLLFGVILFTLSNLLLSANLFLFDRLRNSRQGTNFLRASLIIVIVILTFFFMPMTMGLQNSVPCTHISWILYSLSILFMLFYAALEVGQGLIYFHEQTLNVEIELRSIEEESLEISVAVPSQVQAKNSNEEAD